MPLFGELFISELLKKSVLDPKGDDLGSVEDFVVVKGDPLPWVSAIILEKKKDFYFLGWNNVSIFNKRIISANVYALQLKQYEFSEDDLLIVRDILDKQIVDANGAKVVRVNDVRLEGINSHASLTAVDVGMRGILRRLGIERRGESLYNIFGKTISHNLIPWNYIQPLEPRLSTISLTVPRQMLSALHPADIADIISKISHDEAADLLGDRPDEKAKELLESIEKDEAQDIQELLGHEEDSAGGLMTNEFIAYTPQLSVKDAIEKFKVNAPGVETVYYIYIMYI